MRCGFVAQQMFRKICSIFAKKSSAYSNHERVPKLYVSDHKQRSYMEFKEPLPPKRTVPASASRFLLPFDSSELGNKTTISYLSVH